MLAFTWTFCASDLRRSRWEQPESAMAVSECGLEGEAVLGKVIVWLITDDNAKAFLRPRS